MPLIIQRILDRHTIRAHPEFLYVFGDNMKRTGSGGQASQCRGEANALGLITKRAPRMDSLAFLKDEDMKWLPVENRTVIHMLTAKLERNGTVVWPISGIGTGLAELQTRAPAVLQYYEDLKKELELIGIKAEGNL